MYVQNCCINVELFYLKGKGEAPEKYMLRVISARLLCDKSGVTGYCWGCTCGWLVLCIDKESVALSSRSATAGVYGDKELLTSYLYCMPSTEFEKVLCERSVIFSIYWGFFGNCGGSAPWEPTVSSWSHPTASWSLLCWLEIGISSPSFSTRTETPRLLPEVRLG